MWHLFVVNTAHRDALQAFLAQRNVESLIHYPVAIHQQQCYKELGVTDDADLPLSSAHARRILSLPMFPEMSDAEAVFVVDAVAAFFTAVHDAAAGVCWCVSAVGVQLPRRLSCPLPVCVPCGRQ